MNINAILDDGSTQSFINQDIAEFIGLDDSNIEQMDIDMLNNNRSTLLTQEISFEIQNITTKSSFEMLACTTENVCGNLKAVNWNNHKYNFPHLSEVLFNTPVNRGKIDLLIGLDYTNLHASLSEIM